MRDETSRRCYVEPIEKTVDPAVLESAQVSTLALTGLGCPNCARRVQNSLLSLSGVHQVEVNWENKRARIYWDPEAVERIRLLRAVWLAAAGTHHHYRGFFVDELAA